MNGCFNCKYQNTNICSRYRTLIGECWEHQVKTNADRIRSMTDEEIEAWYWWMHKEMMYYTDSAAFVHNWLTEKAEGGRVMSEQLSERGKDLVKYMPQAVNALADRLIEKLEERLLYGEKPLTNYDKLVSKSPDELAEWLAEVLFHCSNTICDERCPMYKCCCDQPSDNIEDWLRQEVSDGRN